MKIVYSIIITVLCGHSFFANAQKLVEPLFPCTKNLKNPYGVVSHFSHVSRDFPTQTKQIELMKQAGISNVRYDFWVPYNKDWDKHENLPVLDTAIWRTRKANIELLGVLFVGWNGQRAWDRASYYKEFLEYLISCYKEKVLYWEVMNEVNMTSWRDEVPSDSTIKYYVGLLSETYMKLRSANRKIKVTSTGLADNKDDFLEQMCKHKAYKYFDILNFHTYDLPESLPEKYNMIKGLMEKYNWRKPVWLTECGMTTYVDSLIHPLIIPNKQKEKEQAFRLPRTYIISFAYGVDKVYTYNFRAREKDIYYTEDNFGILHSDLSPKPAFHAYKMLTKMLPSGSSRPKLTIMNDTYISNWKRIDGMKVWAIWNSKGNTIVQLGIKGKVDVYDFIGKKIIIDTGEINIGNGIIYIVGGKNTQLIIKIKE